MITIKTSLSLPRLYAILLLLAPAHPHSRHRGSAKRGASSYLLTYLLTGARKQPRELDDGS